MNGRSRFVFGLVLACFFVSGMAGLIYQVVWTRYLALFLGHTSYAVIAVLVSFMGGLALGNAWLGSRADKTRYPLAFYAWLEVIIGVYALLFPKYYPLCHDGYISLVQALNPGPGLLLLLKFLFSLLLILLPTVLMGATFPVLTRFVTSSLGHLRQQVAVLYSINSFGAVAGCIVADFWWIKSYGLEVTVLGGAALNLLAGAVCLVLNQRLVGPIHAPASEAQQGTTESFSNTELRLALLGIGISGFVAMLYEVVWTRLLALALGSSTHAFTIMLITFISGIATGSYVVFRAKRIGNSLRAFAWAEIALGVSVFVSMFFYELLPYWFMKLASLLSKQDAAFPLYQVFQALICFAVMFIPAMLLGTTLPFVSRIATVEVSETGRSVGAVFAINTIGTVLGAALTGLWIMPQLGLAQTFALGALLNLAAGALILFWKEIPKLRFAPIVIAGAGVLFVMSCGWLFDEAWRYAFSTGFWRHVQAPPDVATYRKIARAYEVPYYRDGAGSTVNITISPENNDSQRRHIALIVNGKADASTRSDMVTQSLLGHIPMLLRPESEKALVIGLGSGMTCGSILQHPSIKQLDVVEISPEVKEAARFFDDYNNKALLNPKLKVALEDAKSFLKSSTEKYDIIVSEPSNPWMAGVAGVFTREYYQTCREHLSENGLMVQWVHDYEFNDLALNMVQATFGTAFPFFSIWHGSEGDLVLVGSTRPYIPNIASMKERFEDPAVKNDLKRVDITSFPAFLAFEITSQQFGYFISPNQTPIHSDYYPVLEYVAQRAFFVRASAQNWRNFDEKFSPRSTLLLANYLQQQGLSLADYEAFALLHFSQRFPEETLFRSILARWQRDFPADSTPLEISTRLGGGGARFETEVYRLSPLEPQLQALARTNIQPFQAYCLALMRTYRLHRTMFFQPPSKELEKVLNQLVDLDPKNIRTYRSYLAEIAWDKGNDEECLRLGKLAFDPDITRNGPKTWDLDKGAPKQLLLRMIETLWRARKLPEAWALCQEGQLNGYIALENPYYNSVLEMMYRKLETFFQPGVTPAPEG